MKKFKMPKPDGKYGHTGRQIEKICRKLDIDIAAFFKAFGVNTVAIDENGDINYYTCDTERAIFNATKGIIGGKNE